MTDEQDPIANINSLREKVLRGEELSKEECAAAVRALRANAAKKNVGKTEKTPANLPADLNDLF